MQKRFASLKRPSLQTAIAIEIILVASAAAFFLPGGDDLYRFYLPFAQGCLECGFNPWYASWVLFPITLVPLRLLWPLWVLLTLSGLFWTCRRMEVNPIPVMLAFPVMGLAWLGQVEVVIAVGLMLALLSPSPSLRGAGLVLAMIKPQVAGAAVLVLIVYDREHWKTLIVPALIAALSMLVWGIDWPLRWFNQRDLTAALPVWGTAALYPYGLIAFGAVLLVKGVREKVTAALLASALAFPWFGVYSYSVFLPLIAPWWALPVSYAWLLAYPAMQHLSMKFAWVLPLSLLVYLVWPSIKESKTGQSVLRRVRRSTPEDDPDPGKQDHAPDGARDDAQEPERTA